MADAESRPHMRQVDGLPLPDCVTLVLQGGGALGSYQAGVIEALGETGIEIDWVAGISIGAINAAIFAGNPPERRVERLRDFWNTVTEAIPNLPLPMSDQAREWVHEWSAGAVLWAGVPGFFTPRLLPPSFATPGTMAALSFYDSSPLQKTLDRLIDWELLNHGPVRLSVGAVELGSGNFRYFDTKEMVIDARHIMASGALPPGLPPVEIDGKLYWDGGLVSNTPLTHVMDNQYDQMLVFQVDLFPAENVLPRTITDVMAREKEIRFSSRTRAISDERIRRRQDRQVAARLLDRLPPEFADDPDVVYLRERTREMPISLVHLIYRANVWEGGSRDFEFSARTMTEHWSAGQADVAKTLSRAKLVAEDILDGKTDDFDLAKPSAPPLT